MMRRLPLLLILLFLAAAAPFRPFAEAGIVERNHAAIPSNLPLTDQDGNRTTLRRIGHGRPVLLAPVLHDCPNLCDVLLDGLANAMRESGTVADRDATVVAFGIDPQETPADARASMQRLAGRHPELAGRLHATVADPAVVRATTAALGYHFAFDPRINQFAHPAAVAVMTPSGRLSRWLSGIAPEPAGLTAAIGEARDNRIADWTAPLVLLCYHYDPLTGTYSFAVERVLQIAGALVVLGLLGFILIMRRRERRAS